jgi:hypothetical protein
MYNKDSGVQIVLAIEKKTSIGYRNWPVEEVASVFLLNILTVRRNIYGNVRKDIDGRHRPIIFGRDVGVPNVMAIRGKILNGYRNWLLKTMGNVYPLNM